jgi:hypothetical protein
MGSSEEPKKNRRKKTKNLRRNRKKTHLLESGKGKKGDKDRGNEPPLLSSPLLPLFF